MLYRRAGFPEEHDIVLCTVTKIHFHSVFVKLDEYDNLSGMIHISEVSPGRIRNLSDYVKEGKKIVCKVIRINRERNQIDLSLRRVNEGIRREKLDIIKQELKAEKIVELAARALKMDVKALYDSLTDKVFENYEYLHQFFNDVANKNADFKKYNISEKISNTLTEMISQKIKPPEVEFGGTFTIQSYDANGIEVVKSALKNIFDVVKDAAVFYLGSGKYKFTMKGVDLKKLDNTINECSKRVIDYAKKHNAEASFVREK
jgi:translation initiation factor 2 subunit 1